MPCESGAPLSEDLMEYLAMGGYEHARIPAADLRHDMLLLTRPREWDTVRSVLRETMHVATIEGFFSLAIHETTVVDAGR